MPIDALGALVLGGFQVAGGVLGDGDIGGHPVQRHCTECSPLSPSRQTTTPAPAGGGGSPSLSPAPRLLSQRTHRDILMLSQAVSIQPSDRWTCASLSGPRDDRLAALSPRSRHRRTRAPPSRSNPRRRRSRGRGCPRRSSHPGIREIASSDCDLNLQQSAPSDSPAAVEESLPSVAFLHSQGHEEPIKACPRQVCSRAYSGRKTPECPVRAVFRSCWPRR